MFSSRRPRWAASSKVQIADCRYRPLTQTYDHYNPRIQQTAADYYIHEKWTDAQVKEFRKNVRRQNICVRHGFRFHSYRLERKELDIEMKTAIRYAPKIEIKKALDDAWFPEDLVN